MNANGTNFSEHDDYAPGFSGSGSGGLPQDRFIERLRAFEQGCTAAAGGHRNFLRLVSADLFRTILSVERTVLDELQPTDNRLENECPALRQYSRTLQVLRQSLRALLALETPRTSEITKQEQL
jgi:hypothetical protein